MEWTKLENLKKQCTRDEPVFCTNQCPLDVDVKKMSKLIVAGDFKGAYKYYRSQVIFPEIISRLCDEPCQSVCLRRKIDQAVAVRQLEKACCEYTTAKKVPGYYITPKKKSIAVIGGGLGGLSCAIKLARKGYEVNLYEAQNGLGGYLRQADRLISLAVLETEFGKIVAEEGIRLNLNTKIRSLAELEFDALYIATGAGGDAFGLNQGFDPDSLGTIRNGVFISGTTMKKTADSVLIPVREGIQVAQAIENYLKIGTMGGAAGCHQVVPTRLSVDLANVVREARIVPENKASYTESEAIAEAKRCLQCGCDRCMTACEMLAFYEKPAKKIIDDVGASMNIVKAFTTNVASREINSCSSCGLCKAVCPENLDFEAFFIASRRALHKGGKLPPAFHDFWMQDMAFANSEEAAIIINAEGRDTSSYLFFPGCQLGGSDWHYVTNAYSYLKKLYEGELSMMIGCCGVPAEWAGREAEHEVVIAGIRKIWNNQGRPRVILACPTCKKMFEKYLPEIQVQSLWQVIAETKNGAERRIAAGKKVTVFDPCASRYDPKAQQSIRMILKNLGYQLEELPQSGERVQCCGYGGQMQAVNRPLFDQIVSKRVAATSNDYVTYCTNCRDTFATAGKSVVHILDLLFNNDIEARAVRKSPTLTQRRENRIKLKKVLKLKPEEIKLDPEDKPMKRIKVFIVPEVFDKMDKNFILLEDVKRTIAYCESTGNKILDRSTGNFVGHLQDGSITFWVIYRSEGDGFRLETVYSHRLIIEEVVT
ncbi:pyridine nucleotide-disulfide oxidoreductase/dicluster-binding protein [Acetobacterium carbinolicum]|uniref:pyridine nucleotide-disulfide oxidoreductase/dicluster-binding protein n=1 Tax=Acetobacterium carbinolicum TaxID=52690 RepID=UPI0039C8D778